MFATSATYASPKLNQSPVIGAVTVRAVAPTPTAPRSNARPPRSVPDSPVAFAPAAMAALIEAQEQIGGQTPVLTREDTAQKIGLLISAIDDSEPPPPPTADAPLTVRRLQTAREQLL
jgi:hypothetical protein